MGRPTELAELRGPSTEVIDLGGRLLLPGFTESHIHFIELALRAAQIDVTEAQLCRRGGRDGAGQAEPSGTATRQVGCLDRGGGWDANHLD